jgi:citrate synthase
VIPTETQISFCDVDRDRIVVRGYDLIELAHRAHFADVAFLLIHGSLPGPGKRSMFANALGDGATLPQGVRDVIGALPTSTHPLDALRIGISILATSEEPDRLEDTGHGANVTKGVRILSAAPTIVATAYRATHDLPPSAPEHDLSYPARFLRMIPGAAADGEAVTVFDRVLTCHAEDAPSDLTLAARAVASAGGDIHGAVAAAMQRTGDVFVAAPETVQILRLLDIPRELFVPILLCARTAGLVAHVIEQHDGSHIPATRLRYEGPSGLHLSDDFLPAPL